MHKNWNRYTKLNDFSPSIVKRLDFGIFARCIPRMFIGGEEFVNIVKNNESVLPLQKH